MLLEKPQIETFEGEVKLRYSSLPEFNLAMDFNSIINQFRLVGQFCLLHWQAKPVGKRRWGVYDAGSDHYISVEYCELHLQVVPQLLQVDENVVKTVPTAVLFFPNSKLVKNNYYAVMPL